MSSSASFFKRHFLNNVGYDGTMCCSGNYFLIASNGQEAVKIGKLMEVIRKETETNSAIETLLPSAM